MIYMSKEVLLAVFEKAEKEINSSRITHKSKHIADVLWSKFKFQIDERTLRDYYNDLSKQLKPDTTKYLCKYLGFECYEEFILHHEETMVIDGRSKSNGSESGRDNEKRSEAKLSYKKNILLISSLLLIIIIYFGFNREQNYCMTWLGDQYVKVECPSRLNSKIKTLDTLLLNNFKKVALNPEKMTFFDDKGKTLFWYDKTSGKVEFFTMPGTHPINGKKLKPITQTIVRKYVYREQPF